LLSEVFISMLVMRILYSRRPLVRFLITKLVHEPYFRGGNIPVQREVVK